MNSLAELQREYLRLLSRLRYREEDLDYSLFERRRESLELLAQIKNSGITVFDLYRREHVFVSYNFESMFGFDLEELAAEDTAYFNSRVHPDDLVEMMEIGNRVMRLYFQNPEYQKPEYKLIYEYRIRTGDGAYTRVIEQHQSLELDKSGQIWLALSVVDISPNQEPGRGVVSQFFNFKIGEVFSLDRPERPPAPEEPLTPRESEVLSLIQKGHLSKEISDMLSISLHTVNTHRQRILRKLNANNSMEAVRYAERLGLLS